MGTVCVQQEHIQSGIHIMYSWLLWLHRSPSVVMATFIIQAIQGALNAVTRHEQVYVHYMRRNVKDLYIAWVAMGYHYIAMIYVTTKCVHYNYLHCGHLGALYTNVIQCKHIVLHCQCSTLLHL